MFIKFLLTTTFLCFISIAKTQDSFDLFYKRYIIAFDNNQLSKLAKSFEQKTKDKKDNSSEIYRSLAVFFKKEKPSEKLDILIGIISSDVKLSKELSFVHYLLGKLVMTEFNTIEVSSREYKTAIEISKKCNNHIVTALCYERLARNYTSLKRWKQSVEEFENARHYALKTKLFYTEEWLQLYNNSAYAYERNNDFEQARKNQ